MDFVVIYRDYRRYKHTRRNWESHRVLQLRLHEAEDKLLRLGVGRYQIEKLRQVSWRAPWNQPELMFFKEGAAYWVVAQIFESDRGFVEVGQEVQVEIPAYAEKVKGVIVSVGGIFDDRTRTVNAFIELNDYRGELEGNMFVNVSIPVELNESLIVPKSAVMDTGLRKIVYVKKDAGLFEPRPIDVGAPGDNGWVVRSGLVEGEQVVVEGNFLLDSESRLMTAIHGEMGHD